jgi:hypothetical protein
LFANSTSRSFVNLEVGDQEYHETDAHELMGMTGLRSIRDRPFLGISNQGRVDRRKGSVRRVRITCHAEAVRQAIVDFGQHRRRQPSPGQTHGVAESITSFSSRYIVHSL